MVLEVGLKPITLLGRELIVMPAHHRQEAAVPAAKRIDIPPCGQEVMVDDPYHMKTISNDLGVRKVFAD